MIRLLALGDVCPAQIDVSRIAERSTYQELRETLCGFPGLVVANLECPLSSSGDANLNKIALSADPAVLSHLDYIDAFCLANNHISDLGPRGVEDTLAALEKAAIPAFGVGRSIDEARRPLVLEREGVKLGLLGYSCLTTNGENYATATRAGVCPIAVAYFREDIEKLRSEVDAVLVFLHWGVENRHYPTPDQVAVAHRAVEFGASAVLATHPHVIQGVETFEAAPIAYSLGNFMFGDLQYDVRDGAGTKREKVVQGAHNRESIGVELEVDETATSIAPLRGFALDEFGLPREVALDALESDPHGLSAQLGEYVFRHRRRISKLDDLRMRLRFNGRIHQNVYELPPLDRVRGGLAGVLERLGSG